MSSNIRILKIKCAHAYVYMSVLEYLHVCIGISVWTFLSWKCTAVAGRILKCKCVYSRWLISVQYEILGVRSHTPDWGFNINLQVNIKKVR